MKRFAFLAPLLQIERLVGIGLLIACVAITAIAPSALVRLRLGIFDLLQSVEPREYQPQPIRIVSIDDESLQRYGQWPWPRDIFAKLIERAVESGAVGAGVTILFPEIDRMSPARIAEALASRGKPLPDEVRQGLPDTDAELAAAMLSLPTVLDFACVDRPGPRLPQRIAGMAFSGPVPTADLAQFGGTVANLPTLEKSTAGNGCSPSRPDADGIVRRVPLFVAVGEQIYPTMAAEIMRLAVGDRTYRVKTVGGSNEAGPGRGMVAVNIGSGAAGVVIPTDADGSLRLHLTPPRADRYLSAARLLEAPQPDQLEGHIVLFAATAAGLGDRLPTPVGFMQGVEVYAQAIEQILAGDWLYRPDWALGAEILLVLVAGIATLLVVGRLKVGLGVALATAAMAAIAAVAYFGYRDFGLLLDPAPAMIAIFLLFATSSALGRLQSERDRSMIRGAFARYLSADLVSELLADPKRLNLGGERREMSFIFTDVAGFTTLSEQLGPEAVAPMLNRYLEGVCNEVLDSGGMVNEFIGDAVLAFFGAPLNQPDHARRALMAARRIDAFAEGFRQQHQSWGIAWGHTRIGVHTGIALVGNVGSIQRLKYAALGDVVNTASRIEGLNKYFGTRLCCSGRTSSAAGDDHMRPLGRFVLKGKTEAIEMFEPLDEARHQSAYMRLYRAAYALLDAGDPKAATALAELAELEPDDGVVQWHLQRLSQGERDAVVVMADK